MKKSSLLISVLIITAMTGASEFFHNREIIFPEITAIAVGGLAAPKLAWQTDKIRILMSISLCAVIGVGIVKFIPLPLWLQMILAYALAQIVFVYSGTSFAPMICAVVLPVMMQTKDLVYIASAIVFTAIIMIARAILEKLGTFPEIEFVPLAVPDTEVYKNLIKRTLIAAVLICSAVILGFKFAVAPPLLVALTEFSKPSCPVRKKFPAAVGLITCCGIIGCVCRLVLTITFHIPLCVSAGITTAIILILMDKSKMFIPPAGAIGILAMLVPSDAVMIFPLEIFIGITAVSLASCFFFGENKQQTD